jgi:hypothetical protein
MPEMYGKLVFTGVVDGISVTTALAGEIACADPWLLDAVTTASSVDPTSPEFAVYVLEVAAPMSEHEAPELLQSRH